MATLIFRLLQRESTNGEPTARLMPAKPATMQCLFVGVTPLQHQTVAVEQLRIPNLAANNTFQHESRRFSALHLRRDSCVRHNSRP